MLKTTLVALVAGLAGASLPVVTGATAAIYSSPFQAAFPLDSSIKTSPDVANIWSANIDMTGTGPQSPASVLVDIDGDQQMDTIYSKLRVVITDVQNDSYYDVTIEDSSGVRWRVRGSAYSTLPSIVEHFQTPIVLPVNSDLIVRPGGPTPPVGTQSVRLIGRIVNL